MVDVIDDHLACKTGKCDQRPGIRRETKRGHQIRPLAACCRSDQILAIEVDIAAHNGDQQAYILNVGGARYFRSFVLFRPGRRASLQVVRCSLIHDRDRLQRVFECSVF